MALFEIVLELNKNVDFPSINAVNFYRSLLNYGDITDTEPNIFSGDDVDNFKSFKYILNSDKDINFLYDKLEKIKTNNTDYKNITIKRETTKEKKQGTPHINYLRVEEFKINHLSNYIGELIIAKSNLMNLVYNLKFINDTKKINSLYKEFYQSFQNLDDIVFQLNEMNLSIKMVTFENIFNKLIRVARDLCKEKKVKMIISGSDTQIEKSIIDEIGDPLIHIIRNSIDHGIEFPDERIKKGKKEFGIIKLSAYSETDSVIINISDDGAGLDINSIKTKAIEKKLITPDKAETLNDREIINFIFAPGFSTKDKVTEVSGRGVGMDVVKSVIENINGIIDIKTKKNKGTSFIIKIPLSLSIIETLMVKFHNDIVSIPVSSILATLKNNKKIVRKIGTHQVVMYEDDIIPLINLDEVLNVDASGSIYNYIILIGSVEKRLALLVEDIINKEEVMIKPLNKFLGKVNCIKGATILGNGDVSLILDTKDIILKFSELMR